MYIVFGLAVHLTEVLIIDSNSFMQILLPSKKPDRFEAFLWFDIFFFQPTVCSHNDSQIVLLCKSHCFAKIIILKNGS